MSYYPGQQRTARHLVAFLLFLIGIGLTVGLYYVKTRAQSAKLESDRMAKLVAEEEAAILVLEAEIAHLENSMRLSGLARRELGLEPVKIAQTIEPSAIVEHFPLRETQLVQLGAGSPEDAVQ